MWYRLAVLIAAAVAIVIFGFSYVRIAGTIEWSRARFRRATLIAFGMAFWPLLLLVFPLSANVMPWIVLGIALGGTIGFFAGNAMLISLRGNATLVRIRSTSPIMELIAIMAVADAFTPGSWFREFLMLGGLAFSSSALAGVYAALNHSLQHPDANVADADGDFSVVLRDLGANKLRVVKTLRRETDVPFGDVFPAVRLPKAVLENVDEARAADLRDQLQAVGASVEIIKRI